MFNNFWARLWNTLSGNSHFLSDALWRTLIITFCGFALGLIIATFFAFLFRVKIVNKILSVFIWIIRGMPIAVFLLLMFFVFLAPFRLDAVFIASIVFGINSGVFMAEILRGEINSIDSGQFEAGRALGFSNWFIMRRIILPQAYKNAIPSLGNILILILKDTSIVGFITVVDITKATQLIISKTYDAIVPYILLAIIYIIIVGIITILLKFLEKKIFKRKSMI